MRNRRTLAVSACLALTCLAGSTLPADLAAAQDIEDQAIRVLLNTAVQAYRARDMDRMLALYADDAVLLPPGEPAVIGKDAIRAKLQSEWEQFTVDEFLITFEEITVPGEWAYARGAITVTAVPVGGGEPFSDTAKYLSIFRRQADGSWLLAVECWNRDEPATR